MPRAIKPKVQPIERIETQIDGEDTVIEVWENSADEGTRGAHMRQKRDQIFDAVLKYCDDGLAGNSNLTKKKIERLINGDESLRAFGEVIITLAKRQQVEIGKTLAEEIGKSIRIHYRAVEAALAQIEKEKNALKPA